MTHRQPNYYEGQEFGPESLNQLAAYATTRVACYFGLLAGTGGILRGVREELRVVPKEAKGLQIEIRPGAALTTRGDLYDVSDLIIADLGLVAPLGGDPIEAVRTAYIYLAPHTPYDQLTTDPEIPEIHGYATKILGARVVVADREQNDPNLIELARVPLLSSTQHLTPPATRQSDPASVPGQIDPAFRRYVSVRAGRQLTEGEKERLLSQLARTRRALHRVGLAFHVDVAPDLRALMLPLEAELVRTPIEEDAVRRYVTELNAYLTELLEKIRLILARPGDTEDARMLQLDDLLRRAHTIRETEDEAVSQASIIIDFAASIARTLLGDSEDEEFRTKLAHAISLLRPRRFAPTERIAPAGKVFELKEEIQPSETGDDITYEGARKETMRVMAEFTSGEVHPLEGVSITGGQVEIPLRKLQAGKDVLVIGTHYKRRQEIEIAFSCNGKQVHAEKTTSADPANRAHTIGFLIPGALISSSENRLRITVVRKELAYAFFGMAFYQ